MQSPGARIAFLCAILVWLAQCWFAVRVEVCASLFRALATAPEYGPDRQDELLAAWSLIPKSRVRKRSIADRSLGGLKSLFRSRGSDARTGGRRIDHRRSAASHRRPTTVDRLRPGCHAADLFRQPYQPRRLHSPLFSSPNLAPRKDAMGSGQRLLESGRCSALPGSSCLSRRSCGSRIL
jgi:hypothetical protein